MSGYREIRREDRSNFKKLDHSVKNVFKWRCLEEKDHHTFLIKDMRKVNVPGKFFCNIYKALLSFESTTKKNRNHIVVFWKYHKKEQKPYSTDEIKKNKHNFNIQFPH